MKAVKRLRALRVDVGEVMMGVKKLWEEKAPVFCCFLSFEKQTLKLNTKPSCASGKGDFQANLFSLSRKP